MWEPSLFISREEQTIELKNLYKEELEIKNIIDFEELNNLTKFLDDNIFRIERHANSQGQLDVQRYSEDYTPPRCACHG